MTIVKAQDGCIYVMMYGGSVCFARIERLNVLYVLYVLDMFCMRDSIPGFEIDIIVFLV